MVRVLWVMPRLMVPLLMPMMGVLQVMIWVMVRL